VISVDRRGLADGAQMEDHLKGRMGLQKVIQVSGSDDAGRRMIAEVSPLPFAAKMIGDDGLDPPLCE
jgi:hypothetical protein